MHKLYELKEMLCEELEKYGDKRDLSTGSLEVVDKLAHAIKNIDKIIESGEEGYSERYMYDDGYSMNDGGSYARGRGRNARRDAMGRYSREGSYRGYDGGSYRGGNYRRGGYSRDDAKQEYMENLRRMMEEAPDENTRMSIQRMMDNMER